MKVSIAPHIRDPLTTRRIMLYVLLALLPASIGGVYFFGIRSLFIILISVVTSILVEIIIQKINHKKIGLSGSCAVTGLLLGLLLPPTAPYWIPIIGAVFAVLIAKHAFGSHNAIFNPALVAFVFLKVSWPHLLNTFTSFDTITTATPFLKMTDAITGATPLTSAKMDGINTLVTQYGGKIALYKGMFIGGIPGAIGETSVLFLAVGAIFLLYKKIITWHIPFTYIGTVVILSAILKQDILFHLLAGGLMIGAFFMATDYVTTPITKNGRIIFGIGCGILTVIIRMYSGFPEGVAYSILLMNAATPLLDRITKPKPFGYKK